MDAVTRSWTFGDSQFGDTKRRTNMITDWNGDIVIAENADSDDAETDVLKWTGESAAQPSPIFTTKEIDFGNPAQRKKIYKIYLSVTPGITPNVTISAVDQDGGAITFDTAAVSAGESAHKVTAGGNNIKTLTLTFTGASVTPATFELNDISIVYREKGIK